MSVLSSLNIETSIPYTNPSDGSFLGFDLAIPKSVTSNSSRSPQNMAYWYQYTERQIKAQKCGTW